MNVQRRAANIAFMYHDNDAAWRQDIVGYCAMLRRQGLIAFVDQAKYMVMPRSDIILILISSDFLASDKLVSAAYYAIHHRTGDQRIIPILVRKVNLEQDFPELHALKGFPAQGKTLEGARFKSEVLTEIAQGIRQIASRHG